MAVNFETLLRSIVANPAEAVASLRLLRAEDERQLLYGWNETFTEFPQELVHELFERQVERTPNHTAVVFEDVSVTYLELNRRSNLLATHLRSMGVGADTVVGVMLERSVEMLVGVLGVLKAGGAYLPLDPQYPAERLQFMLADAAVRVLLTQEQLAHNVATDVRSSGLTLTILNATPAGHKRREPTRAGHGRQPGLHHLHVRLDGQAERGGDDARAAGQSVAMANASLGQWAAHRAICFAQF